MPPSGRPTCLVGRPRGVTSSAPAPLHVPLRLSRLQDPGHERYLRPSREAPASSRPIVQQLFKDGAATESPMQPQTARVSPMPQKSAPEAVLGAPSTRTSDAQRKSTAASPSPKKARSQSSPTKPKDDVSSEGPTIADLTAMVQQLRLENMCLENQLAERKIEMEELRDDLRLMRRGLSAKIKRLFEVTGHKDLY